MSIATASASLSAPSASYNANSCAASARQATRVLIVDDHPVSRSGILTVIASQPELTVCGEADSVNSAISLTEELKPQLIVTELTLRQGSGIELVKNLTERHPGLRILVFSRQDERLFAERCLRAGAHGYLNKNASLTEFLDAIQTVMGDRISLSEIMTCRLLSRSVRAAKGQTQVSPIEMLSNRELQVFEQLGRGISTRQIAEQLLLSRKTVETYRENIKLKLNLRNASELTQHAVKWVLEGCAATAMA